MYLLLTFLCSLAGAAGACRFSAKNLVLRRKSTKWILFAGSAVLSAAGGICVLQVLSARMTAENPNASTRAACAAGCCTALFLALGFTAATAVLSGVLRHERKTLYLLRIGQVRLFPVAPAALLCAVVLAISSALLVTDKTMVSYADWETEHTARMQMRFGAALPTQGIMQAPDNETGLYLSANKDAVLPLAYPLTRLSFPLKTAEEETVITVVGDSFVFGYAMQNMNHVFWRQLEYELERRGYNCRVNAVGVGGATAEDELGWLTDTSLLRDLSPDLLLIGYVYNDLDLRALPNTYVRTFANTIVMQKLHNAAGLLYPNIAYLLESKTVHGVAYYQWCLSLLESTNMHRVEARVTKPLAALAEEKNLPVAVVTLPTLPNESYYAPLFTPVEALYTQNGIPFYNALDAFCNDFANKKHSANYYVNPVDGHPGTASSYFFAQYIADFLERDYADILGEKTEAAQESHTVEINDWLPYMLAVETKQASPTAGEFTFTYPAADTESAFMTLPLGKDYIELSFAYPVDLESLVLESDAMQSAEIYTTAVNPALGYDDLQPVLLGSGTGSRFTVEDTRKNMVTSLYIHLDTANKAAAACSLRVTTAQGGVSLWTK